MRAADGSFGAVRIEVRIGDIAAQADVDAVANAANADLAPGSGVAGAIHRAAGPGLHAECRELAPIEAGQCVLTGGHDLPAAHVIHCLGPVYGRDEPADELLANCYRGALLLADQHGLSSVAFPAISTGVFGYPLRDAAMVALEAVRGVADDLTHVRVVRFVLFEEIGLSVFRDALRRLTAG